MVSNNSGSRADVREVLFRFYGALNDFLPPGRRRVAFSYAFEGRVSVKDAIEAVGVPHPEVDLILACGTSVDFSHHVHPGDRIAVYPLFRSLDVGPASRVRPPALDTLRFVLDGHLGRLAGYLRLAGFDSLYETDCDDETLAEISSREQRILLTRDVALLKRGIVTYGYWLRATNPRQQLAEIAERFDLASRRQPFSRCIRCNGTIVPTAFDAVTDRLPPRTRDHYREFWECTGCGRVYWKGAHYAWLSRLLASTFE